MMRRCSHPQVQLLLAIADATTRRKISVVVISASSPPPPSHHAPNARPCGKPYSRAAWLSALLPRRAESDPTCLDGHHLRLRSGGRRGSSGVAVPRHPSQATASATSPRLPLQNARSGSLDLAANGASPGGGGR
jgi:hypothetical protein